MSVLKRNCMKVTVNSDGAAEPVNPGGIASYGFVVGTPDGILKKGKGVVGEGKGMTNNVAEYSAAIHGLRWVAENLDPSKAVLRADSELIVKQISGAYSVKSERLYPLYEELKGVIADIEGDFEAEWVPREENREADALSKEAIEEYVETHDYRYKGHPVVECDECGAWMVVREGEYGKFFGCSRYPACKNTKPVEEVEDAP